MDIFAVFIFLGIIQGILLSFFFLSKKNGANVSNRMQGLILLALSAFNFEILLCYSGYITKAIHLVDFSEPLNFFIGPAFYFIILARIHQNYKFNLHQALHFLPFILYGFYSILFYIQTSEFKFNAFLSAYHPKLSHIPAIQVLNPDPLLLKRYVNELSLMHLFIYVGIGLYIIHKAFKQEKLSFFSREIKGLVWLRNFSFFIMIFVFIWLVTRIVFEEDLGDHLTASFISIIIYAITFSVIKKSSFFSEKTFRRSIKYEKSALSKEAQTQTLKKLQDIMEKDRPYLDNSISLPKLAKRIQISSHHLSQILNDCLNKNFFEFIADYRIREAEKILSDPKNITLMIEEVAEIVGYNSKSAFNNAFKKLTGLTPSQFREKQN